MDQFGTDALLCPLGANGRSALASSAAEFLCAQGNEHMVQSALFGWQSAPLNRALQLCKLTYRYGDHHTSNRISSTLLVHGPFLSGRGFLPAWVRSITLFLILALLLCCSPSTCCVPSWKTAYFSCTVW